MKLIKTTRYNRAGAGELWGNKAIDEKIDYIHQNPVEAGLVFRAEDYMYSSASDYAGEKGLLNDIIIIK